MRREESCWKNLKSREKWGKKWWEKRERSNTENPGPIYPLYFIEDLLRLLHSFMLETENWMLYDHRNGCHWPLPCFPWTHYHQCLRESLARLPYCRTNLYLFIFNKEERMRWKSLESVVPKHYYKPKSRCCKMLKEMKMSFTAGKVILWASK